MNETYIKIKGKWRYLYRAVDKFGKTVDFLVTKKPDAVAAKTFFCKAFRYNKGDPTCSDSFSARLSSHF
ncbi:MAG: hypothetical protein COB14_09150 [Alphaproteobacteria bacterium]|nr:MAG: hypothetical protein COB14_09150 [Alphaproteobacteria bacterium]